MTTSDTPWTPGPWKVRVAEYDKRPYIWADGLLVAKTYRDKVGQEVGEANARLIAAAPELVAALEKLTNPQHPNDLLRAVTEGAALLARIKGEGHG